ncbi:MAG: hypothetical protein C4545_08845 [Anaerolineaceae bacterium]|nr:MAG: hypothetical protein C4545_08845 [Anaerolineaceae bacterium]
MNEAAKTCPYLGLIDDQNTHMSFPSDLNCCHRAKPIEAIQIEHQQAFCLNKNHKKCSIFNGNNIASLPVELRAFDSRFTKKKKLKWRILLTGTLVTVAVVLTMVFSQGQANLFHLFQANPTSTIPPAKPTITATQTPTIRPMLISIPIGVFFI